MLLLAVMKSIIVNKQWINELPWAIRTPIYLLAIGEKIMRRADDGLQIMLI
jgi:hypothetical protein